MKTILSTRRLLLREAGPQNAAAVAEYVLRNKEFLEPWEPKRVDVFYMEEAQRILLESDAAEIQAGRMVKVWLSSKEAPERIIGSAGLSNIVRGVFQSCHLGYRLDGELQGNGFMSEAVEALVEYAFDVLRLHRIEANIMPRNEASLSIVRKLGFHEEGLALRYLKINGVWEDHIHMVKLNDSLENIE